MEAETRARTKYAIGVVASEVFGATIAGAMRVRALSASSGSIRVESGTRCAAVPVRVTPRAAGAHMLVPAMQGHSARGAPDARMMVARLVARARAAPPRARTGDATPRPHAC